MPAGYVIFQDYYSGHKTRAQLETDGREVVIPSNDIETNTHLSDSKEVDPITSDRSSGDISNHAKTDALPLETVSTGKWYKTKNWLSSLKYAFFHGVEVDVVAEQGRKSVLAGDLEDMHARAEVS